MIKLNRIAMFSLAAFAAVSAAEAKDRKDLAPAPTLERAVRDKLERLSYYGVFDILQYQVKDGGIVTAYDSKTGKEIYQKRAIASGSYYASPVAADGHIYFASLADGTVTVLQAGTAKPEVVAENPPLGERVSATPAIANDTLYVRTAGHLYAFATQE